MSEHIYSFNLDARVKNMEDYIKILEKEKSLREEKVIELKTGSDPDQLAIIDHQKKIVELTQELLSKNEFLSELRKKGKRDEKEMKKNLAEANARYHSITDEAEKFLDEDEKANDGFSWTGIMVNHLYNGLVLSKKEKDEGKICFWYNALKKELKRIKAVEENEKKAKEAQPLKAVTEVEGE